MYSQNSNYFSRTAIISIQGAKILWVPFETITRRFPDFIFLRHDHAFYALMRLSHIRWYASCAKNLHACTTTQNVNISMRTTSMLQSTFSSYPCQKWFISIIKWCIKPQKLEGEWTIEYKVFYAEWRVTNRFLTGLLSIFYKSSATRIIWK